MIPVFQDKFGSAASAPNELGNCVAACVASILELPLKEVPNFCIKETWWNDLKEWLTKRGYLFCYVNDDGTNVKDLDIYYICSTKNPQKDWDHVVVCKKGKMVHNPFPNGGVIECSDQYKIILKTLEKTKP